MKVEIDLKSTAAVNKFPKKLFASGSNCQSAIAPQSLESQSLEEDAQKLTENLDAK